MRRRAGVLLAICAAVSVSAASGCGSSAYGDLFQHRLEQLKISSQFTVLRDPTTDLAINFRVPQVFTKEFTPLSADPDNDSRRIAPFRFLPPGLPGFPGLLRRFEAEYLGQERSTVSLLVGEGDPATVKDKFPYGLWQTRLQLAGFQVGKWEPVKVQSPTGGALDWNRLKAKTSVLSKSEQGNGKGPATITVNYEMWVYETPQAIAVLGWLAKEDAWTALLVGKLAELTAGTAVVSPNAAAILAPAAPPAKAK